MDFLIKLLNKQVHFSDVIITSEEVRSHQKDFDDLLALGVLEKVSDPQHIWCRTCQNEGVEVHYVSPERAYTLCAQDEHSGRDYFNPSEIKQWRFNLQKFLELAADGLGIKRDVKKVVTNDLWLVGTLEKDGRNLLIFYSRTNDLNAHNAFFDAFKSLVRAFVIFTNIETPLINVNRAEVVVVPIAKIVEVKKNSLSWGIKTFQEQVIAAFRQVVFYPSNGDFMVLGKIIGNVTPSSPEYFFALSLWESFNQPVGHESIFSYCKERLSKQQDYTDTAQAFCNKMKSNIKKHIKNDIVDKIIVSTKTPNGSNAYKMTIPS